MKNISNIFSLLLAICLAVGFVPTVAFAAGTDTGKTIQLGTNGISGYNSTNGYDYIYYGTWDSSAIKWRVLDDQTNTGESGLFLLSDVLLGTGSSGGVYFDNSGNDSNVWQGSDAQAWCKDFAGEDGAATNIADAFTAGELGAILVTTKSDEAFTSSTYSKPFSASDNILNGDKVFFLSAQEAKKSEYGFTDSEARKANYNMSAGIWWLRSPDADYTYGAGAVYISGNVMSYSVFFDRTARPAFNLNLNAVLFTSAAVGGKISTVGGGNQGGEAADAIFEIPTTTTSEWKLTLLDSSRNFSVTETAAAGKSGDTITLNYTGATVGTNEYISVIVADNEGAKYYGRITQPASANGTVNVKIPANLAEGSYTLNVFSEQYNGGANDDTRLTDYASKFDPVTLTVDSTRADPFRLRCPRERKRCNSKIYEQRGQNVLLRGCGKRCNRPAAQ